MFGLTLTLIFSIFEEREKGEVYTLKKVDLNTRRYYKKVLTKVKNELK